MIKTYRRKPGALREAIQWTGDNDLLVKDFVGRRENDEWRFLQPSEITGVWHEPHLYVDANKAWLPIELDEWIIKDSEGYYPCKNNVFMKTYEEVTV